MGAMGAETVHSKIKSGRNLNGKRDRTNIFQFLYAGLPKHVTGQKKAAKIKGSLAISITNAQNIAQKKEGPVRLRNSWERVRHSILFGVDAR
jgi:hypothetical protein